MIIKKFNRFVNELTIEASAFDYDEPQYREMRDNITSFELACKKVIFDKLRIPVESQKNVDISDKSELNSEYGLSVPLGPYGKGHHSDGTFKILFDKSFKWPKYNGIGDYDKILDDFKKTVNIGEIDVYQLNGDMWDKWSNGKVLSGKSIKADREWRDRGNQPGPDSWSQMQGGGGW